ncbi:MAG: hypothetical protein ACRC10_04075 [Thermoguttaceae bacterium]
MTQSLVLRLQENALDSNCSITDLLRLALVVATKLNKEEDVKWLEHELNGYPSEVEMPLYRRLQTSLIAIDSYTGIAKPCFFEDARLEEPLRYYECHWAINRVEEILNVPENQLAISVPPACEAILNQWSPSQSEARYCRQYYQRDVKVILQSVRDRVLLWSLELEKQGILGESLQFTPEEKNSAQTITIHNSGNIGSVGDITNSQVMQTLTRASFITILALSRLILRQSQCFGNHTALQGGVFYEKT